MMLLVSEVTQEIDILADYKTPDATLPRHSREIAFQSSPVRQPSNVPFK